MKYGKTPQQRIEEAIFQPMQRDDVFGMSNLQATEVVINRLIHELTNSHDYFYLWQSNIAMAFYDAAAKYSMENGIMWDQSDARITHEIANAAAKNFLNNLCSQPKILEKKKPIE
jgi:hypothetical protein